MSMGHRQPGTCCYAFAVGVSAGAVRHSMGRLGACWCRWDRKAGSHTAVGDRTEVGAEEAYCRGGDMICVLVKDRGSCYCRGNREGVNTTAHRLAERRPASRQCQFLIFGKPRFIRIAGMYLRVRILDGMTTHDRYLDVGETEMGRCGKLYDNATQTTDEGGGHFPITRRSLVKIGCGTKS
jgi:hypothetical protein